jgi:hypothetical protein
MYTTILVIALVVAAIAILTYVAFRRGSLSTPPLPSDTKGHFVLMLKKVRIEEDDKESKKQST